MPFCAEIRPTARSGPHVGLKWVVPFLPFPSGERVTVSCVILAAGTSSRLGEPKQLLELSGKPVLQHVLDVASGTEVDEIVVVLGHEADRIEDVIDLPR